MNETRPEVIERASEEARPLRATPAVDVFENADEVLILADLPGVTKDAVSIRMDERELAIEASRETPTGERVVYRRAFTVPRYLDGEKSVAELRDGVLHLRLPKRETAKPRRIQVTSA